MTSLEWVLLGTFVTSIIFFIFAILSVVFFVINKKHLQEAKEKKSKRKAQKREIAKYKKKKKNNLISSIVFLIVALVSGILAGYTSYYQTINLSQQDSESVVEAYYLLTDMETQLKSASESKEDEAKIVSSIKKYGAQMASFSSRTASPLNKEEGQILLNRYYNTVKEIGVNTSSQSQEFYGNEKLVEEFLKDIEKAKDIEKNVFKYYKVDEGSLEKEI